MERITYMGKQIYPRERKQRRDTRGRFTVKSWLQAKWFAFMSFIRFLVKVTVAGVLIGIVLGAAYGIGAYSTSKEISVVNAFAVPTASADTSVIVKSVEELKEEMADKLCGAERGGIVVDDGDLFSTFDPSEEMKARCTAIGGLHPKDCMSYGICQEKIGTIQHYYPEVYGKEISEIDALVCANTDSCARAFFIDCSVKVQGCVWNWTEAKKHKEYYQVRIDLIRKMLSE